MRQDEKVGGSCASSEQVFALSELGPPYQRSSLGERLNGQAEEEWMFVQEECTAPVPKMSWADIVKIPRDDAASAVQQPEQPCACSAYNPRT